MSIARMRAKYVSIRSASARNVAERWRSQYQHPKDGWSKAYKANSEEIYNQLIALGDNPPTDKVAAIVGNQSWSYLSCDGCSAYVERAVEIGEHEPKAYCQTCIAEAAAILGEIAK